MRRISIDLLLVRGGVAALLAASAVVPVRAQVVPVAPVRSVVKDSVVLRMLDGSRIPDSLRLLIRAFDIEPFSSMESIRMAQKLEALAARAGVSAERLQQGMGGGRSSFIVITGSDGIKQGSLGPTRGWIGLTTGGVHNEWAEGHFLQYLDYPPIVSVERPSPAQVAGIVPGDTLIAYDGVDVVAHPIDVTQLLTPDKKIAVTVRRDGENKAFTLTVARMPMGVFTRRLWPGEMPMPPIPGMSNTPPGDGARSGGPVVGQRIEIRQGTNTGRVLVFATGALGASLYAVSPDAARVLKIEPGVLVNEVPEGTPAYVCGLRAGDVIVSVGGQPVVTVDDVRTLAMLRGENHPVTMQIIRDKKPRSIIVK